MIFFRDGKVVDQVVGLLPPSNLAANFEGLVANGNGAGAPT
jgi:hypothetical protein